MNRLRDLVLQAASSLWLVPLVVTVLLGALALGLIAFDGWADSQRTDAYNLSQRFPWLFMGGVEGARSMLATTAGALVTAGGVTLSGVLVALSIASGQYTSRILRSFTGNRVHQMALGLILGSFVYSLTVLRSIGSGADGRFVPDLAVFFALPLAFISVAALLVFVHGVARSIQASEILAKTAEITLDSARLYFEEESAEDTRGEAPSPLPPVRFGFAAKDSGYLREVDGEALAVLAEQLDSVIVVEKRVGDFIVQGERVASVAGASEGAIAHEVEGQILSCLRVGTFRTTEQDPGFGVRQLVDIALRALSPGINDTTTAEMSTHRLIQVLDVPAAYSAHPSYVRRDGRLRVVAPRHDFESLLTLAFEQLLRAAESSPRVLATIAEGWVVLHRTASRAPEPQEARVTMETFAKSVETWMVEAARAAPTLGDAGRVETALERLKR